MGTMKLPIFLCSNGSELVALPEGSSVYPKRLLSDERKQQIMEETSHQLFDQQGNAVKVIRVTLENEIEQSIFQRWMKQAYSEHPNAFDAIYYIEKA